MENGTFSCLFRLASIDKKHRFFQDLKACAYTREPVPKMQVLFVGMTDLRGARADEKAWPYHENHRSGRNESPLEGKAKHKEQWSTIP